MLWECNEVHELCEKVSVFLDIQISYRTLIMGENNITHNNIISLIMYCVYKIIYYRN